MLKNINTLRKKLAIYDLSKTETAIVEFLYKNKDGLTINTFSSISGIQRLTLLHSLKKLLARKLVQKDASQKAHVWKLADLRERETSNIEEKTISEAFEFMNKNTSNKLYGIQGTQAVQYEIDNLKIEKNKLVIKKIHTSQKLKSVVMDGIVAEDTLELLKDLPTELKKSHYGRATIAHVLPRGSLNSPYELIFNQNYICLTFQKENKAVIFHNKHLSEMLITLHSLFSLQARKINLGDIYKPD